MRAAGRAVRLRVITDCEYVCHGGNRLVEGGGLPKTNRDLWMELQQAIQKRSAPSTLIKVKAYQDHRDLHTADLDQWRLAAGMRSRTIARTWRPTTRK